MASPIYQTQGANITFRASDGVQPVAVPSGTVSGDTLFLFTRIRTSLSSPQSTINYPSGFTPLGSFAAVVGTSNGWDLRYLKLSSAPPSTYDISATDASYEPHDAFLFRVSGAGSTPINAVSSVTSETGSGPLALPAVTATEPDTLLLTVAMNIAGTQAISPAGALATISQNTALMSTLVAKEAVAASGSVSGRTNTVAGSSTYSKFAVLVSSGATGGAPDTLLPHQLSTLFLSRAAGRASNF